MRSQKRVQLIKHDARFDGDRLLCGVKADDSVEILAVIDNERSADRLSALRAAGAAGEDRDLPPATELHRRPNVVVACGHENGERIDLVDRSIRRVTSTRCGVRQQFTLDVGSQIVPPRFDAWPR